jgi:hypothetical protein
LGFAFACASEHAYIFHYFGIKLLEYLQGISYFPSFMKESILLLHGKLITSDFLIHKFGEELKCIFFEKPVTDDMSVNN